MLHFATHTHTLGHHCFLATRSFFHWHRRRRQFVLLVLSFVLQPLSRAHVKNTLSPSPVPNCGLMFAMFASFAGESSSNVGLFFVRRFWPSGGGSTSPASPDSAARALRLRFYSKATPAAKHVAPFFARLSEAARAQRWQIKLFSSGTLFARDTRAQSD